MKKLHLKSAVILFALTIFPMFSFAQSKLNVLLDYHYQLGISEKGVYGNLKGNDNMHGNSFHLSLMYNISSQLSAGAGIGADRYENPGYNTFPVFASVHYSPLKSLANLYAYTNIGYAVIDKQTTNTGLMWDLGIGYKKMFRPHFGLNFQLGYNLKQFRGIETFEMTENTILSIKDTNNIRNSLSIGIGLIF